MSDIIKKIQRALEWRNTRSSFKPGRARRLFSGSSDGIKGLWVDQFGELIVLNLYNKELVKNKDVLSDFFEERFKGSSLLFKTKTDKGFESNTRELDKDLFTCSELDCVYYIKTDIEHDFGLFLDTHAARLWLSESAKDKTILNLFSYTCAFGVVGMKNGAQQVTNIDPCREYLEWGKLNAKENDLDFRNLCDPAQKYLPRHIRRLKEGKDHAYDIVIADPPAFLVGRGDDRLGRKIWPKLLEWFVEMSPRQILLICNDRSFRQTRDMKQYFKEGLNDKYDLKKLVHDPDLKGQNFKLLLEQDDYLPPDIYVAELK